MLDHYMKRVNAHWKAIDAQLRTGGFTPAQALAEAKAARQNMHHDAGQAAAFEQALTEAERQAADAKAKAKAGAV